MEHTFQPGDPCLECQQLGISHCLRTFYINLEEQIVKCESDSCIYPYENDLSDSEEDAKLTYAELQAAHSQSDAYEFESTRFIEELLGSDLVNDMTPLKEEVTPPTVETVETCHANAVVTPAVHAFDFTALQAPADGISNTRLPSCSFEQKPRVKIEKVEVLQPAQQHFKKTIKTEQAVASTVRISHYFDALKATQRLTKRDICTRRRKFVKQKKSEVKSPPKQRNVAQGMCSSDQQVGNSSTVVDRPNHSLTDVLQLLGQNKK